MALLISDNPIVTTYPEYLVEEDWDYGEIYTWLRQYSRVGIGRTMRWHAPGTRGTMYRVYAKLKPEIELLFTIKYGARRRYPVPLKTFNGMFEVDE